MLLMVGFVSGHDFSRAAEKVRFKGESSPQRPAVSSHLKPRSLPSGYGRAEARPLQKSEFFRSLFPGQRSLAFARSSRLAYGGDRAASFSAAR
jgi:hypothetical protein